MIARRIEQILLVLILAGVKGWFLGRGRYDDARYALAQRRGERLIRRMSRDGSLKARSPRKVIRIGGAR